jgi:pyruvate formate lyase activating enzyme
LFHVLPGARALSFGMLGCDYHCSYCQNWLTSQALRDPLAGVPPEEMTPEGLVKLANRFEAQVVTSTYNEPLITSEWAVEIFKVAKAHGLITSYVSNGNATPEVLEYLRPWVDAYKVDLKGFNEQHYRTELGGQLSTVLETIRRLHTMGFWVEIVTLIVPGFNDTHEELCRIAEFLVSISPDIPWHVTAFHQDYKMTEPDNTPPETLMQACEIGQRAGLRYVYAGNLPGRVGSWEHTSCPTCRALLIERRGYTILQNILDHGRCPSCQTMIPGCWSLPMDHLNNPSKRLLH